MAWPRSFLEPNMPNLAPTWKPERLQNRGPNLKKSMLKNNTFFASIFKGFGPRFGKVFGRFFWNKNKWKLQKHDFSENLKNNDFI